MTTKEYLSQVRPFDREINRKIDRLGDLYADAVRVTALFREAPGGGDRWTASIRSCCITISS